jgi:hypothetical protein
MAAYSFVVVGLSSVLGSLIAGTLARAIDVHSTTASRATGVSWVIGGGAAIMLAYGFFVFERRPNLRSEPRAG